MLHICIMKINNKMYKTMKTINKSKLMKRAWTIYKSMSNFDRDELRFINSFAECLKRAWAYEKEDIEQANRKPERESVCSSPVWAEVVTGYYRGTSTYFGD